MRHHLANHSFHGRSSLVSRGPGVIACIVVASCKCECPSSVVRDRAQLPSNSVSKHGLVYALCGWMFNVIIS